MAWARAAFRIAVRAAVAAALLVAGVVVALLATGADRILLRYAVDEAVARSAGRLAIEGVEGSPLSQVRLGSVRWRDGDLAVEVSGAEVRWAPLALLWGELRLGEVGAKRVAVRTTVSDEPLVLPGSLALPLAVAVSRLAVDEIVIVAGDTAVAPLRIEGSYRGGAELHRFDIERLAIAGASLRARIDIGAAAPFRVNGLASVETELLDRPFAAAVSLAGPLETLDLSAAARLGEVPFTATARVQPFAALPLFKASLRGGEIDLAAWSAGLPRTSLTLEAEAASTKGGGLAGRASVANGDPGPMDTNRLPVAGARFTFEGSGGRWRAPELALDLGPGGRLAGSAGLDGATVRASLSTAALHAAALHRSLRLPPLSGSATLDGNGARQDFTATLSAKGFRFDLEGAHESGMLTLARGEVRRGRGLLSLAGRIGIDGPRRFDARGRLGAFDPSEFGDFPAASLNAEWTASGELLPKWQARVALKLADSRLRGRPLSGEGDFTTGERRLFDGRIELALGNNRVSALGRFGQPGDHLDWTLAAPDLAAVDPAWRGSAEGSGVLGGSPAEPTTEFRLSARGLALGKEWSVGRLDAEGLLSAGADGAARFTAAAADMRAGGQAVAEANVRVDGARLRHSVTAGAKGTSFDVALRGAGGLGPDLVWRGKVEQFENRGAWPLRLLAEVSVEVGADRLAADEFRLAALGGEFRVAELRAGGGTLATRGEFTGLQAGTLLAARAQGNVESDLLLRGRWKIDASDTVSGSVEVERESGDVVVKEDPPFPLRLERLRLSATAERNDLAVSFEASTRRASALQAKARTRLARTGAGFTLPDSAPLELAGEMKMDSLAFLRLALTGADRIAGRIDAHFEGRGTVGQPELSGTLTGEGLALRGPLSGFDLRDGVLRARLEADRLRLDEFSFKAGAGTLRADGEAVLARGLKSLDIRLQATQATVQAAPDRRLVASGEGSARLRDQHLTLEGSFRVDEGRLELARLDRPALGSDVVVVGRKQRAEKTRIPLKVDADVALDLNDRFFLTGRGLDAQLGGQLRLTRSGDDLAANGTVRTVRGLYTAYGQRLEIERGVLNFRGPPDNPGLDILAQRDFGKAKVGVAVTGTLLAPRVALVSDPEMSDAEKLSWLVLGSDPGSAANRRETGVVQGAAIAAIAQSSGDLPTSQITKALGIDQIGYTTRETGPDNTERGFVTLGKQVTRDLYVSFEQSVDATAGTILRADYFLSRGWRIRGSAGGSNALDLFFTLRYD